MFRLLLLFVYWVNLFSSQIIRVLWDSLNDLFVPTKNNEWWISKWLYEIKYRDLGPHNWHFWRIRSSRTNCQSFRLHKVTSQTKIQFSEIHIFVDFNCTPYPEHFPCHHHGSLQLYLFYSYSHNENLSQSLVDNFNFYPSHSFELCRWVRGQSIYYAELSSLRISQQYVHKVMFWYCWNTLGLTRHSGLHPKRHLSSTFNPLMRNLNWYCQNNVFTIVKPIGDPISTNK
jgi:hypothetical protein